MRNTDLRHAKSICDQTHKTPDRKDNRGADDRVDHALTRCGHVFIARAALLNVSESEVDRCHREEGHEYRCTKLDELHTELYEILEGSHLLCGGQLGGDGNENGGDYLFIFAHII